ncbi:type VII toxin-antitoxin system MntA family adenylyltransferase antitoxin [Natranaerofaba carboxydovora]|uniref:type VII toxin-antitoxin system MntA family adenylyltransferase antitoxin n=1 Tax=Natranaerofaba carboxydovora TaxID=2742683 RepID=UPI001F1368D2|nr:nucleotidyltransferase domain-containing protein [Natranaerofaba carboxydovora]UMZ74973.1 Nucleotidyltransferase domain protein [Natranaerofaba carboxydovora]
MDVQKIKYKIKEHINDDIKNHVVTIYIFGSRANKKNNPNSDYDIAVLLKDSVPKNIYFDKKLDFINFFTGILETDHVDLVILNEAPLEIAYRIFAQGTILYENQNYKKERVRFQSKTYSMYFDFLPVKKTLSNGLKKRIKGGRYGGG